MKHWLLKQLLAGFLTLSFGFSGLAVEKDADPIGGLKFIQDSVSNGSEVIAPKPIINYEADITDINRDQIKKFKEELPRYQVGAKNYQDPVRIKVETALGEVEIEQDLNTPAQDLRKFSPRSMAKSMAQMASLINQTSKISTQNATHNLLPEAAVFYIGLGALAVGKALFDFSGNPVAVYQNHMHQLSFVGITGVWMFLKFSGWTGMMMPVLMRNPRLRFMFPMMSMSAGVIAQSIYSELIMDPMMQACFASVSGAMSGKALPNRDDGFGHCEAAFDSLVIGKRIWKLSPTLVSMTFAVVAQGFMNRNIVKGAKYIALRASRKSTIRLAAIQLVFLFSPQSRRIKGLSKILIKSFNMATFAGPDMYFLQPRIVKHWRNHFDGKELEELQEGIISSVIDHKQKGWSGHDVELSKKFYYPTSEYDISDTQQITQYCSKNLNDPRDCSRLVQQLIKFRRQMSEWRQTNLLPVLESYSAWAEYLTRVSTVYDASKSFYHHLINEVRKDKWPDLDKTHPSLLTATYPLFGSPRPVWKIESMKDPRTLSDYLYNQPLLQKDQMNFIDDEFRPKAALAFEPYVRECRPEFNDWGYTNEMFKIIALRNSIANDDERLNARYLAYKKLFCFQKNLPASVDIAKIMSLIDDDRPLKKSEGIVLLQTTARNGQPHRLTGLLGKMSLVFGFVYPKYFPGQGYLASIFSDSNFGEQLGTTEFPQSSGYLHGATLPEHLLLQMVCGPDPENRQWMIHFARNGTPASFLAPKIVNSQLKTVLCDRQYNIKREELYNGSYKIDGAEKQFRPPIELIRQNIKPNILGTFEKSGFDNWWDNAVEYQLSEAYKIFQRQYSPILVKFLHHLKTHNRVSTNGSYSMSNGILDSLRQEIRFYAMLIVEVMKDHLRTQNPEQLQRLFSGYLNPSLPVSPSLPVKEFRQEVLASNGEWSQPTYRTEYSPLILKDLLKNPSLDFSQHILNYQSASHLHPIANYNKDYLGRQFQFQERLMAAYEKIFKLFDKYEVRSVQDLVRNNFSDAVKILGQTEANRVSDEIKKRDPESDQIVVKTGPVVFDYETAGKEIQEIVSELQIMLGAKNSIMLNELCKIFMNEDSDFKAKINELEKKENILDLKLKMDPVTLRVLESLLEGLTATSQELVTYGAILNVTNWENVQRLKELSQQTRQAVDQLQQEAKEYRQVQSH